MGSSRSTIDRSTQLGRAPLSSPLFEMRPPLIHEARLTGDREMIVFRSIVNWVTDMRHCTLQKIVKSFFLQFKNELKKY